MTDGRGSVSVPPTTGLPPPAITVALPARTSTRARRNETTASGSYAALRTSEWTRSPPFFWARTLLVASRPVAGGVPGDPCRRRAGTFGGQDDRRRRPPTGTTP